MGGIAGIVHFRGPPPARADAVHLGARLAHRGPDGEGAWAEHEAAFAHRLRRVRPGRKVQPLVERDLVLLLDGWIYDHQDLVQDAGGDLSDTEALLVAWRRWGRDALERIEGEFAFAVWERGPKRLHLVRDRLGVRPLHHAQRGDKFAFASEGGALLELTWVSREPDVRRIAEYLSFGVVHSPRTVLADVQQVEPGTCLTIDADGPRPHRYWRLRYAPPDTPRPREADVVPRLQEVVDRAVRKRVPAGVPTGLYLSGGLGSAAIGAAARHQHRALPAFTVSFADDPYPETAFAGRVAKLMGIELNEVTVRSADLAATFDEMVALLGQPIASPGVLLQLALARRARASVRVALAGDGGEELFGGRQLDGIAAELNAARRFQMLPGVVRTAVGRWWPSSDEARSLSVPIDRYALVQGLGGANLFGAEERATLLRDPALVRPAVRREVLEGWYAGLETDPVNTILHGFLRSSLTEVALVRTERTAAAMGLDVRLPLLDREVVEAAAALPGSFKLRRVAGSVHTRWPLRALLEGELPEVLVDRPKRGLPGPPGGWLANAGRLFLEDRCARLKRDPRGLWRGEAIDELKRSVSRSNAAENRLWTLFALDSFLNT